MIHIPASQTVSLWVPAPGEVKYNWTTLSDADLWVGVAGDVPVGI